MLLGMAKTPIYPHFAVNLPIALLVATLPIQGLVE